MKFHVLGSFGGTSPDCRMTSFLIDNQVAVDAGAITNALSIEQQLMVRHVLITHSHMDHTATVPFLVENTLGALDAPIAIYATARVLAKVRNHLFNNDTWPDFTRIPHHDFPAVRFVEIKAEEPFVISDLPGGDLEVTPIKVNHIVQTVGFLLRQGPSSIVYTSDTGPTERIWEVVNDTDDLTACITECSFPSRMKELAKVSLHLCPDSLAVELAKIKRKTQIYLYHFKPPVVDELRNELAQTTLPWPVTELEQGRTYTF